MSNSRVKRRPLNNTLTADIVKKKQKVNSDGKENIVKRNDMRVTQAACEDPIEQQIRASFNNKHATSGVQVTAPQHGV